MSPEEVKEIIAENQKLKLELMKMSDLVIALKNYRYGRRTERVTTEDQPELFNEAEFIASKPDVQPEYTPETEAEVSNETRTKKKRSRRPLPESLERVVVEVNVPESEKKCSENHDKICIGTKVTERLEFVPARIQVKRYVRHQYACRKCDEAQVSIAPLPASPIPKSVASPSLLAAIVSSKYSDHLPLYRQEEMFRRMGADLSRGQLARWLIQASKLLEPIADSIRAELLSGSYLQCDETTLQVLKEPGRAPTAKSYIWTLARPPGPDRPLVY